MLVSLADCRSQGEQPRPSWVHGMSQAFPSTRYLVGVGQSSTRSGAEEQAYVALSRIFKSDVSAQSKDQESYLLVEKEAQAVTERKLTLEKSIEVSTDKILENVRILDAWFDAKNRQYYALAGMEKAPVESMLTERIQELDTSIAAQVNDARMTPDKRIHAKQLRRAIKNSQTREAYNMDLHVIRASGAGIPPIYRISDLIDELERYLATNLAVGVTMTGDQAEPVRRALIEGLTREGLSIAAPAVEGTDASAAELQAELLVTGTVRLWPLHLNDPRFTYVRWCTDAIISEAATGRVIGAVSKGGKEGHLTEREAVAKAVRVMQKDFSSSLARSIANHIYGEDELPSDSGTPPGCPRAERPPAAERSHY
jgi:hypothetical protein